MRSPWARLAWLLPIVFFGSCLAPQEPLDRYVSLRLDDTLSRFDSVRIVIIGPDSLGDTLDVLWSGPPPAASDLAKVKVENYVGGEAIVLVMGFFNGDMVWERRIRYQGPSGIAVPEEPRWHDLPPVLIMRIRDTSIFLDQGIPDSLGICEDDKEGMWVAPLLGSTPPDTGTGIILAFQCVDRLGHRSAKGQATIRRMPRPDTVAPVLTLKGPDSLDHVQGTAYVDSGWICIDDRDSVPEMTLGGTVTVLGRQVLTYRCRDQAGNATAKRQRIVNVVRPADTVAPVLTLKGPDSLGIFRGASYVDSGAVCHDDRDGDLPVDANGIVRPDSLGRQALIYRCRDIAGNPASARTRVVIVSQPPDTLAPVLTLKGPDSLDHVLGTSYVDSGWICTDDRDSVPEMTLSGVVDTVPGRHVLTYGCRDQAGNATALRQRVVKVVLPADTVAPVLTLKGPDSLGIFRGALYVDSGAVCHDDRDGKLTVDVDGTVRHDSLGRQTLTYRCRDQAGNPAPARTRIVIVSQPPDTMAPVLTLKGPDSLDHVQGRPYVDSGWVCIDDRDSVPVMTLGGIVDTVLGRHALTYGCRDQAGNATALRQRIVNVVRPADTVAPVLTLKGPDSLDHVYGEVYVDSGAACVDDRDGARGVEISGAVGAAAGRYVLAYGCRDIAGNAAPGKTRTVRVRRSYFVEALKETILDTTNYLTVNSGFTPLLTFGKMTPPDPWATVLAFDLDKVDTTGLRSATATFHTYVSADYQKFDPREVVFVVHRVLSPWQEGTGSWYFHDGKYDNYGEWVLLNHPVRPEIMAKATNPAVPSGLTGAGRSILRVPNMAFAGKDTMVVRYGFDNFSHGGPGTVPATQFLVKVEIDLTRYVRETPAGQNHGLVITMEGMPDGLWINWVTKELGDGTLGPRLKLEY